MAPTNVQCGSVITRKTVALIDERAAKLSMSRSKYLALIVEKWATDGCPAINEADRAMKILEGKVTHPKRTAG